MSWLFVFAQQDETICVLRPSKIQFQLVKSGICEADKSRGAFMKTTGSCWGREVGREPAEGLLAAFRLYIFPFFGKAPWLWSSALPISWKGD